MFDHIAQAIPYQNLDVAGSVQLIVKRLDLIHPQISGNKFFKLKYNLIEARQLGLKQILTFGGAYSNHIAATAYAAQLFGFKSIGIIRGEELAHKPLNPTLTTAQQLGMQLVFVSREKYRQKNNHYWIDELTQHYPNTYIIPEGGTNELAIQGCQEILTIKDLNHYDVICCAVGTGGTMTGLINASSPQQEILGFSALKGDFLQQDISQLTHKKNWQILDDYCFGGYAKTNDELLSFINNFEQQYRIPLEQIYTGKMFYGVFDLISKGYFKENSKILILHSGGLQGRS
ncbi:1-aminocyclopropane-1-carboxylate deaminase/D-cysteine desulfhydrase [Acinetobacter sp. ULE_I001]|uniref:1-aminocyclopropane-1-carboxylate deaminase/D-cysteine desulfhydrase n=1 Tax=unclassified Acinetobacter TaxID=196816 RepID=UPI003AF716C3